MVKHIVMFRLKGTPEERLRVASEFKKALEALPAQIDCLQSIEVGLNQNPAEEWDVVLTAEWPRWIRVPRNHTPTAFGGCNKGQKRSKYRFCPLCFYARIIDCGRGGSRWG